MQFAANLITWFTTYILLAYLYNKNLSYSVNDLKRLDLFKYKWNSPLAKKRDNLTVFKSMLFFKENCNAAFLFLFNLA